MENILKDKIMEFVAEICAMPSISCRGLDKSNAARKLLDIANVPNNAEISEIPLDWDNQVVILFLIPNDKYYYGLFAGIGTDGNFYFNLFIAGVYHERENTYHFKFYDKDKNIPIDYFRSRKE